MIVSFSVGVQTSRKGIGSGAELMATSVVSNDADLNSTDANLNNICGGGGEMERLQDTVTAYEMQKLRGVVRARPAPWENRKQYMMRSSSLSCFLTAFGTLSLTSWIGTCASRNSSRSQKSSFAQKEEVRYERANSRARTCNVG